MFCDVRHAMSNVCGMLCDVCLVTTAEGWLGGALLWKAISCISAALFCSSCRSPCMLQHGLDAHCDWMQIWHTAAAVTASQITLV